MQGRMLACLCVTTTLVDVTKQPTCMQLNTHKQIWNSHKNVQNSMTPATREFLKGAEGKRPSRTHTAIQCRCHPSTRASSIQGTCSCEYDKQFPFCAFEQLAGGVEISIDHNAIETGSSYKSSSLVVSRLGRSHADATEKHTPVTCAQLVHCNCPWKKTVVGAACSLHTCWLLSTVNQTFIMTNIHPNAPSKCVSFEVLNFGTDRAHKPICSLATANCIAQLAHFLGVVNIAWGL